MINAFDWSRIFKTALKNGGWLAEAFFEKSRTASILMEGGRLEKSVAGLDQGLGLRILFGEQTVYGYTNELTEKAILDLARELSLLVGKGEAGRVGDLNLAPRPENYQPLKPVATLGLEEKGGLVKTASEAAFGFDPRIRQVKCAYMERAQEVFIATSEGRAVEDTRTGLVLFVQTVAESEGVIQTGMEPQGGAMGLELFEERTPAQVAEIAASRAIKMLEAKPAPGGRMPVVLSSKAGGTMIHEAVGHGLEADLTLEGLSVYTGKIGEMVASELVTVVDDATIPGKRGSFGVDDEGSPARKTVLVENGKLIANMTDRRYAKRGGLPLSGNGRRESYRHRPIVRMTNTLVLPGESDPDKILKDTPEGLFVLKMGGGQVNTATGDFVFEVAEGHLIENGTVGEPVRGATLVGNGPQVLESIDAVGNDLGYAIGTCGKDGQGAPVADAQPTMRLPELLVGGAV